MFTHISRVVLISCFTLMSVTLPALAAQEASVSQNAPTQPAQRRRPRVARPVHRAARTPKTRGARRPATSQKAVTAVLPKVLSGEEEVKVTADYGSTIRVGLAPNGIAIVEFPAADSIHRVHNGNDAFVTVDYTNTKVNEPLVFRPGTQFVVARHGNSPATQTTVQMGSGMFFTFLIYPVASIAQSASRVVVSYNRAEIVAARRKAGLPVDYKPVPEAPGVPGRSAARAEEGAQATAPTPTTTSSAVNAAQPTTTAARAVGLTRLVNFVPATAGAPGAAVRGQAETVESLPPPAPELVQAMRDALKQAMKNGKKSFGRFTPARHGLALAVTPARDLNADTRFVIIAVRNTLKEPLRLVAGQPELLLETDDENKRPVQSERVRKIYTETTAPRGNMILPGATVYYAVAYQPLVLGVQQHFRVSVAQDTAADAPAFLDLTVLTR